MMNVGQENVMGEAELATKPVGHAANLHRYRGTPPNGQTQRMFKAQLQMGMSGFRKEIVRQGVDGRGVICHPTKSRVYGYVAEDGRLVYER